jgi:alkylmercury lyase-like protein
MDVALRNLTYRRFVELGRAPLPEELGDRDSVLAGWRALHAAHALVLDGDALRMAHPFSAVPTPHRVYAQGRWWYANCAWDAFGILASLHCDGEIATICPDCGETLDNNDPTLLFHCLVPASRWWADIVFT